MLALISFPVHAQAPIGFPSWYHLPIKVIELTQFATDTALAYQVNPQHLTAVIRCESSWKDTAKGDHGLAYGLAQFHEETFDSFKASAIKQGEPFQKLEYKNPQDQITLMAWAFKNGLEKHWSCTRIEAARDWE